MSDDCRAVDASTSNAGDDFHLDWAVRRSLELLKPRTELVAVKPEGTTPVDAVTVDPSGHKLLAVDLTEYYGGHGLGHASRVVYFQLKYSTTDPSAPWTMAGGTRGKRAPSSAGSLIRRLADVFMGHLDAFGREQLLTKMSLRLARNPEAVVCVIIDAADNSVAAARLRPQNYGGRFSMRYRVNSSRRWRVVFAPSRME